MAITKITKALMAANSNDSDSYVDGSIDTIHVGDNQITLAKMAGATDGNIISFDASGDPVYIATGSDGQVLTSAGAGAPPAFEAAAAGGKVLQCLSQVYTTQTSTETIFANDDTIPQITEGVQIFSQAITPAHASNILMVDLVLSMGTAGGSSTYGAALFQDSTANALAYFLSTSMEANTSLSFPFFFRMAAGTTSATTFTVRIGGSGSVTKINILSGGGSYGSILQSTMRVWEIAV
tara:strand:+ start:28 stop:738 length:711 start_codon:yes stop_codon:yes gene_type:complete